MPLEFVAEAAAGDAGGGLLGGLFGGEVATGGAFAGDVGGFGAGAEDFFGDTALSGTQGFDATAGTAAGGTMGAGPGQIGYGMNSFYPGGGPSNVYQSGGAAPQWGDYGSMSGPPLSAANPMAQMQYLMKGVGAMPWGQAGGGFNMASGAYGMYQAQQMQELMKKLQSQGDPFSQYRSGYGSQLQNLMNDPSSVSSMPGYQFGMDQGTQALMRSQAAGGLLGSGQGAMALQKYGQDYAGTQFQQQLQNLMNLSGANVNPGNNANLQFMGNQANLNLQGNALNRIGYGSSQLGYGGGP